MWAFFLVIGSALAVALSFLGSASLGSASAPARDGDTALRTRRVSRAAVVAILAVTLGLAFLEKVPFLFSDPSRWGAATTLTYTDYPVLFGRGFDRDALPYLQSRLEYPVLSGLTAWVASVPADDFRTFSVAVAVLMAVAAMGTALLLHRMAGARVLFFILAPTLVVSGFLNLDLLPVFLVTAAIAAFVRRRDGLAGALIGLGAAAKLYPALLLPLMAADRIREGGRRPAMPLVWWGLGAWLVLNAPFALLSFDRWVEFYRFSAEREPLGASLWGVGCRELATGPCLEIPLINAVSMIVFLAASATVWRLKVATDPEVPRWTLVLPLVILFLLTNKIYSPQYSLWLLPLFALVLPDVRLFVAFVAADLAVFVAELPGNFPDLLPGTIPDPVLDVAAVARALVLLACIERYVTTPWSQLAPPELGSEAVALSSGAR